MIIKNKELTIRKIKLEDADILYKWWTDGKVMEHAGFPNGLDISIDKIRKDIAKYDEEKFQVFIIEIDDKPVGEMNYRNKGNKTAEMGIKVCDADFQNRGYGTTFLKMFIEGLFNTLKYDKIMLDVNAKNLRAKHVYEKIGFKKIDEKNGSWVDQLGVSQSFIFYELVPSDFFDVK